MKKNRKRTRHTKNRIFFYPVLFALLLCSASVPLYWNSSGSLPKGLYLWCPWKTVQNQALVIFNLPEDNPMHVLATQRGYPVRNLQKRVVALAGDEYHLPACAATDSSGRGLLCYSPQSGIVPDGMAMVQGNTQLSFDSRYYGTVPLEGMRVVVPVWTY